MNDRTPEQIDNALDRSEQILAQQSIALDRLIPIVEEIGVNTREIGVNTRRRLQQHDLELDDHDERVERLERDHLEHSTRMAKLEGIQADIKSMLELLVQRSIRE